MSWSTNHIGSVEKVRAAVNKDLDGSINCYRGTPEEGDVVAAKLAINTAIDTVPTGSNGVNVQAHGSRSSGYVSMSISVACVNVEI